MNTNLDQVRELLEKAIGGRAYLVYPQQKVPKGKPFAVLSMSATSYLADREGRDIQTLLTYTVRVHAQGQRELLNLSHSVVDELAPYRIRLLGMSPMYSDPTYGPMQILTFDTIMDTRGNTFSTG